MPTVTAGASKDSLESDLPQPGKQKQSQEMSSRAAANGSVSADGGALLQAGSSGSSSSSGTCGRFDSGPSSSGSRRLSDAEKIAQQTRVGGLRWRPGMKPTQPADASSANTSSQEATRTAQISTATELQHAQIAQAAGSYWTDTWMTNDSAHGSIEIPKELKIFIDTPIFQRMRHIKQLGLCELVYMGATHTRFSHSIGVCYLAFKFMKRLQERNPERCSKVDVLCVCLAGLLVVEYAKDPSCWKAAS